MDKTLDELWHDAWREQCFSIPLETDGNGKPISNTENAICLNAPPRLPPRPKLYQSNTGWACPLCRQIHSPYILKCDCKGKTKC